MPLIAVVTSLFPSVEDPSCGTAIYRAVLALQNLADVEVYRPVAVYPPFLKRRAQRPDLNYRPANIRRVQYLEYPALPLVSRPLNGELYARRLHPYLEQSRADVVLSYWSYPDGYAAVKVARKIGKPVAVFSRGSDLRSIPDPISRMLVRKTLRGADFVLTVSEDLRQRAIALGAAPERTRSIPNGCNPDVFYYDPSPDLRLAGVSPGERIILFVGRLSRPKGMVELLEAFRVLAAENPRLRLVCAGEAVLRSEIESFARNNGLQGRIVMTGQCSAIQVANWMNIAAVFCLPSYSEGCPNVVLEAVACGCPVVATTVGGIPEILLDQSGILVPPQDSRRLTEALRRALLKDWDRQKLSKLSKRGWDEVAVETLAVCEDVIKHRSAVSQPAVLPGPRLQRRLKIAVVTPYFPVAEDPYRGHSAYQTLRRMPEEAEIEVFCPVATYPKFKRLEPRSYRYRRACLSHQRSELKATYLEYPVLPVITRPVNGFICASYLEPYLKASRPDVILNYWLYPEGFGAVRVGHKLKIPVIVGCIGSDICRISHSVTFYLTLKTLRDAAHIITVSHDLRKRVIEMGLEACKATTILNGCDSSMFHPGDRTEARRLAGLDPEAELVLFVGWLSPTKGVAELLDAFIALSASRPALQLALIGEGAYQNDIEHRIEDAGIVDQVLLLGRLPPEDVVRWMAACDVFCLPSHSEGCPNVVVEAIACGRPVVATHVGGIPELVNESCGLLVPARDSAKLAAALKMALDRKWDAAAISRQLGRDWQAAAKETYDICRRTAESWRAC